MNEENSYVNAETPRKKKRSLWWLWFLLLLAAFAGGCVVGLKINTLPLPTEVRDRLYPVLESYIPGSTTPRTPDAVAVTPEPTSAPVVTPEPTAEPEPTPEVTPAPEATAAPVETLVPAETAAPSEKEAEETLRLLDDSAFESAAQKKYIGVGAALEAALRHAKIAEEDAEISGVYRAKDEDGETVYEVGFRSGELQYDYQVDAYTGEIAGWKIAGFNFSDTATFAAEFEGNDMPEAAVTPAPAPELIGEEKAEDIAFAHAAVKTDEVLESAVELLHEGETDFYRVTFKTAAGRFEYRIDAVTGEVLADELIK